MDKSYSKGRDKEKRKDKPSYQWVSENTSAIKRRHFGRFGVHKIG